MTGPGPPATPLLSYRNDATGEHVRLSAAELGEVGAAVAALLTDGCGLGAGSRVAVLLPPHWQTAAVLLGAWAVGIQVSYQGWATAGLGPGPDVPFDASFVAAARVGSWLENIPDATHRFVVGGAAAGYRELTEALRPYAGVAPPRPTAATGVPATPDGTTYGQLGRLAGAIAQRHGLGRGDRVLVDAGRHEEPVTWLLAPLAAGASVVIRDGSDPAAPPDAADGVTHVL